MAETYILTLSTDGPWAGCDTEDEYSLSEFGYTDEEWDALGEKQRQSLLDEWALDNFWNQGYEYYGEVNK